jgi:hypothetical protein
MDAAPTIKDECHASQPRQAPRSSTKPASKCDMLHPIDETQNILPNAFRVSLLKMQV